MRTIKLPSLTRKKARIDLLNTRVKSEYNRIVEPLVMIISVTAMPYLFSLLLQHQKELISSLFGQVGDFFSGFFPSPWETTAASSLSNTLALDYTLTLTHTSVNGEVLSTKNIPIPLGEVAQKYQPLMGDVDEFATVLCPSLGVYQCKKDLGDKLGAIDNAMFGYSNMIGMKHPREYLTTDTANSAFESFPIPRYIDDFFKHLVDNRAKYQKNDFLLKFNQYPELKTILLGLCEALYRLYYILFQNYPFAFWSFHGLYKAIIDQRGELRKYESLVQPMNQALTTFSNNVGTISLLTLAILQIPISLIVQKILIKTFIHYVNPIKFLVKSPQLFNTSTINTEAEADQALTVLEQEQARIQRFSYPEQYLSAAVCVLLAAYQFQQYCSTETYSFTNMAYTVMLGKFALEHLYKVGVDQYRKYQFSSQSAYQQHLLAEQESHLNKSVQCFEGKMRWVRQGENTTDDAYFLLKIKPTPNLSTNTLHAALSDILIRFGVNVLPGKSDCIAVAYNEKLNIKLAEHINETLKSYIDRLTVLKALKNKLSSYTNTIKDWEFDSFYVKNSKNGLPMLRCDLKCANPEILAGILTEFQISYNIDQNKFFNFTLTDQLSDRFFQALRKRLPESLPNYSGMTGTQQHVSAPSISGHQYKILVGGAGINTNTGPELKQPALVESEGSDKLPDSINFKEFGYFKKNLPCDIKPILGMHGYFVLFSPPKTPLTVNHFENDEKAFAEFKKLCDFPKKAAPHGEIGFKRDSTRTLRNFLWQPHEGDKDKYVTTSGKAKILGGQGKGKKRLFFRSVKDSADRYTLYVPCHYDSQHSKRMN